MRVTSRWSLSRFVRELGSPKPVPGGGSAAALTAALGCALGSMVGRILLARSKTPLSLRKKLRQEVRVFGRLTDRLEGLVKEDARVYLQLVKAARHQEELSQARRGAMEIPLAICSAAGEGFQVLKGMKPLAGRFLSSDVKAGLALLQGGFLAAWETAKSNVNGMSSPAARRYKKRLSSLRRLVA